MLKLAAFKEESKEVNAEWQQLTKNRSSARSLAAPFVSGKSRLVTTPASLANFQKK